MRRLFADRIRAGLGVVADVFGQLADHRFELVDPTALLVHHLVELFHRVFLVGELDFDIDKTVFVTHGMSLRKSRHYATRPLPPTLPARRKDLMRRYEA
jgi:hypothetical protein